MTLIIYACTYTYCCFLSRLVRVIVAPAHAVLRSNSDNLWELQICCDCNSKSPQWASVSYGCFMCLECSGKHRGLGVHISFVRCAEFTRPIAVPSIKYPVKEFHVLLNASVCCLRLKLSLSHVQGVLFSAGLLRWMLGRMSSSTR
jgi:Putative GTPase activating protein for Arf